MKELYIYLHFVILYFLVFLLLLLLFFFRPPQAPPNPFCSTSLRGFDLGEFVESSAGVGHCKCQAGASHGHEHGLTTR